MCPARPALLPQLPPGPLLWLDGGTWSHLMSLQSLSLPSLKWGLVSWTRGFAWDMAGSLCCRGCGENRSWDLSELWISNPQLWCWRECLSAAVKPTEEGGVPS